MNKMEGYMHGVNLGGWLSQCDHTKERYDTFIKREDIEKIAGWGLDHVRLPIDYELIESSDGSYMEEGFSYIDSALDWCGAAGLNMVLDLHKTFGFSFDAGEGESGFFDNKEYQERFCRLWEVIAKRYGSLSKRLCFELLNEVTEKEYSDEWNRIAGECVGRIRRYAGDIKILYGGYHNNSVEAVEDLVKPLDENVIYNFHCYEPLVFTHQGGYWVAGMDKGFRMPFDVTYGEYAKNREEQLDCFSMDFEGFVPGEKIGPGYFEKLMERAVKAATERGTSLYCGEYGVINLASPEDTLKWYRMICGCFDRFSIARAAWSYKEMDFGLADDHLSGVISELIKII